jgi:hypothetical protein
VRVRRQLKAPGFCNAETSNLLKKAPDVSAFVDGSVYIRARSSTNYSGFKLSLAADTLNRQFASYKVSGPKVFRLGNKVSFWEPKEARIHPVFTARVAAATCGRAGQRDGSSPPFVRHLARACAAVGSHGGNVGPGVRLVFVSCSLQGVFGGVHPGCQGCSFQRVQLCAAGEFLTLERCVLSLGNNHVLGAVRDLW